MTYLKFTKKNVQNARENVNLLDLKMIHYVTDAKNVKKMYLVKRWITQKVYAHI